jgi:NADH-dependent peroxiredoxin subunit F
MLDANLKGQLAAYLQRISQPIELVASLDGTPASGQLRELLADIASTSPLVSVAETTGGPYRSPSFSVGKPGESPRVRFAGLPMGHEFTSLVLALLNRRCNRCARWKATSNSRSTSRSRATTARTSCRR